MKHETAKSFVIDRDDRDWYKDAIIYQLHIKAFQDSNGDGVGDFRGLIERLDYVQELGVTTIWVLPFYPSPLRDDGYDIADYRSINPVYGRMSEFKAFVTEAHRRGLRVITELVINHTSDQHPWFQRARRAKPGSAARDMYVWSDTDKKFEETRIIFTDTETSNWSWDPVAGAYFWHRFYSHQPDLNFDNPRVLREVLKVMHLWLDAGVDGLRLDAIPYLIERDGTNNENLPETHEVLKKIRAELDAHYPDRMLLAEANQWPEDTRPYFGDGDECHMGFHFPLMPRMYMAVAQEDRHPITDIIRQTPDIPENCQWAIFLRNHDELTLEMVTDKERDYLWRTYAQDNRARINLGIRRRLAPLLQNDRRKIELMNLLLMTMPGTPIVYYGDEIGMGDNYYLGDRDGVRTPMQWSSDRNAGFSRANPQQLYLPAILDPIYGYPAVNVESQESDPSSLLNWTRRIISVRKQHKAFGRGTMTLLYPKNRKVLAYIREYEGERILCMANLSRAAEAVELDLSRWKGAVPVELTGYTRFPPIGDLPYLVTLPAYGFYWFLLAPEAEAPRWHQPIPEVLPEFITLTSRDGRVATAFSGSGKRQFEEALPAFLPLQRWFGAKDQTIGSVDLAVLGSLSEGRHALTIAEATVGRKTQRYFLPLSVLWGEEHLAFGAAKLSYTICKLRRGSKVGALVDGSFDEDLAATLLHNMRSDLELDTADGKVLFRGNALLDQREEIGEAEPLSVEQTNVTVAFGQDVILKIYRRLYSGVQPEIEVARYLTEEAAFPNTPAFLGYAQHVPEGAEPEMLAAAFGYVTNQGNAWEVLTNALGLELDELVTSQQPQPEMPDGEEGHRFAYPLAMGELLGQRTAALHVALARDTEDPAFSVEPVSAKDLSRWVGETRKDVDLMLDRLQAARGSLEGETAELADGVLGARRALDKHIDAAAALKPAGGRSRIHGDYHLGQLLVCQNDLMIIDFEGEPRRTLDERRAKTSPLRDVAGMMRSLDYAAHAALIAHRSVAPRAEEAALEKVRAWRDATSADFLDAYFAGIAGCPTVSGDAAADRRLLDLMTIQKAAYEVVYELANRPDWLPIPLGGILEILERKVDQS
jgi:maltose alpha-D-glucosyltransferase/alpha-amylase